MVSSTHFDQKSLLDLGGIPSNLPRVELTDNAPPDIAQTLRAPRC